MERSASDESSGSSAREIREKTEELDIDGGKWLDMFIYHDGFNSYNKTVRKVTIS